MRSFAMLLALLLVCPLWIFSADTQSISGEELKESGIMRLADIHLMLDDWAISTIDGYTWAASPGGLGNFDRQRWIVMIDGIPVDIDIFDVKAVGRLPISISQIDHITVHSEPILHQGYLADGGLIDIRLIRPDSAGTAAIELAAGNETKDPGPFRYTEYQSPNVDKIGTVSALHTGISRRKFKLGLSYKRENNYNTDPAIMERNRTVLVNEHPVIETSGGLAFLDVHHGRFESTTHLVHSKFDDLFFERNLSNEIPTGTVLNSLGHRNRHYLGSGVTLSNRLSYSVNKLNRRPNNLDEFDYDWEQRNFRYNYEIVKQVNSSRVLLGFGYQYYLVKASQELTDDDFNVLRFYAGGLYVPRDYLDLSLIGELTRGETGTGYRILHHTKLKYFPNNEIAFTLLYYRRIPEQDPGMLFWEKRRYDPYDSDYFHIRLPAGRIGLPNRLGLNIDLNVEQKFNDKFEANFGILYRRIKDGVQAGYSYRESGEDLPYFSRVSGEVHKYKLDIGVLDIALKYRPFRILVTELKVCLKSMHYREKPLEGILDPWNSVPREDIRFSVKYRPTNDLSFVGRLYFQGKTTWDDYWFFEATNDSQYSDKAHDFISVDFALTKYFWNRRLRGTLTFRNIFDDTIRYHPIGAAFDRSYYAVLEFNPF